MEQLNVINNKEEKKRKKNNYRNSSSAGLVTCVQQESTRVLMYSSVQVATVEDSSCGGSPALLLPSAVFSLGAAGLHLARH